MKLALALLLVGCTSYDGERATNHACPPGETCSPLTPDGLQFIGTSIDDGQIFTPADNHPTAVGGTQDFDISLPDGQALDLPFTAEVGGPAAEIVAQHGTRVTVRGIADAYGELKIRDANGLLMDETQIQAVPMGTISVAPGSWESYRGDPFVVAPGGNVAVSIGAVDTSMTIDMPGSQPVHWDEIAVGDTPGTQMLTVTAAGQAPQSLPVTIVENADAVAALDPNPQSIAPRGSATLCFAASNASRPVVGLSWQFAVDGVPTAGQPIPVNCVGFSTTKTSGAVSVTATAGGASTTITLPIAH